MHYFKIIVFDTYNERFLHSCDFPYSFLVCAQKFMFIAKRLFFALVSKYTIFELIHKKRDVLHVKQMGSVNLL